jgi:ribosome maturation factor RimP
MVLRITVDKKGGVSVDECAWANERMGEALDRENFLIESYTLEVCSPGLDRLLKTRQDFEKVKGEVVKVRTHISLDDQDEHIGKVISCDEEHIMIELVDNGTSRKIPLDKISKAQLKIKF